MPKVKLDHTFCLTAQCEPGKKKTDYYDTSITGFVLEVRSSGGRSYYLRYQDAHGDQKQHRIAAYGDITFDKARKEAQRLRSEVVLGGNPAVKKAERKAVPAYGELAQKHLDYAKTYQRSYDTTEMYVRRHILPKWEKRYLSDIAQPEVAKWLAEKGEEGLAPATVEKIRMIFNRSFELAMRWNIAGVVRNPVKGIPRKPINNARDRFLNAAETKRLLTAAQASRNPQLVHIIAMLLYTGARVSELLQAEWKNVDLDKRQWLIPTSKTGKPRRVPLSEPALAILKMVPRFTNCPYVLPNPETLKPFVTIKHGWHTARDAAKLSGLRIHDLRHSAASFMINAGIDLFAVGRVLGHADHKSTLRYSHAANDTLLAAVEAGARRMQGSPEL
ncbi:tyrosine-type recombinase/integrase [Sphingomonas sp. AR_OL41]|uniref:tyrosine-type recombinase/integrase n=1 Tax=Sphingomonas sp. AR_OL41 TaxID=3042729 RepID=UPI0024803E6F|nr:site-specific integrase [Sphingomonas sp. AR_OL41]MDH7973534.1 tyrosine-type recombinase/integrase [Sphingomonas sp. AR_OL41]